MADDIFKRRQLLKDKLEGKVTEENVSAPQIRKGNSTRLHIPTIFQRNSENPLADPKLSTSKPISKSTGNLNKDFSLKLTNFQDIPAKPPRKLSSASMKISDAKSTENISVQHESKLRSRSFSVTKSSEENDNPTNPVIVSTIKKKPVEEIKETEAEIEEKRKIKAAEEKATEEGLVMLRSKLNDLRNKKMTVDLSPTMHFNFFDKGSSPVSPKSPITKKIEQNPILKRSGSRVGIMIEDEIKLTTQNDNYDNVHLKNTPTIVIQNQDEIQNEDSSLYDNINLKNNPVQEQKCNDDYEPIDFANSLREKIEETKQELVNNKAYNDLMNGVKYENIETIKANNYYSKKFNMGPVYKHPIPSKRSVCSN